MLLENDLAKKITTAFNNFTWNLDLNFFFDILEQLRHALSQQ